MIRFRCHNCKEQGHYHDAARYCMMCAAYIRIELVIALRAQRLELIEESEVLIGQLSRAYGLQPKDQERITVLMDRALRRLSRRIDLSYPDDHSFVCDVPQTGVTTRLRR